MISFRRLTDDDLPLMHRWLNDPEVVRWWEGDDVSMAGVIADYGSASDDRVEHWLALRDGEPFGWIEWAMAISYPEETAAWRAHGASDAAASIDYLIGEATDRGQGLGSAMIDAFVTEVVFGQHPEVDEVVVDPMRDNGASWGALRRVGFEHLADIDGDDGVARLMRLRRPDPPAARPDS